MSPDLKAFAAEFETGTAGPHYSAFKAKLLDWMKRVRREAAEEAVTGYAEMERERNALQTAYDQLERNHYALVEEVKSLRADAKGEAFFNDR